MATGTLDWVFAEYRADRRFTKLDRGTRRLHERGFRLVGDHVLKDDRPLGDVRLTAINTAVVDALYEKPLIVKETDAEGNTVERERRTSVNHAMKTGRGSWNIAARRNPGKLPTVNPFAAMGLISSGSETPTATFAELEAFRAMAVEMALPSLATAAFMGWSGCNVRKLSSASSTPRTTAPRSGLTRSVCCTRRPTRRTGCLCSTTRACGSTTN